MTRNPAYLWLSIALVVLAFAASIALYPRLPDTIPTHWNIRGEVDGHGAKHWAVFLMPITMAAFLTFFWLLPWMSPKDFEIEPFASTFRFIMFTVIALFAYMHGVILLATWKEVHGAGRWFDLGRALSAGIFLFFALLANVLGKVRRNFWVGVRTPWTLASERVWNDTHRLAAWTMVAGGLGGFAMIVCGLSVVAAFVPFMISLLIPLVYSFVHYKVLERRGEL